MRTTFRRQLTLTICLIFGATMLMGISFLTMFGHYATQQKERSLRSTAQSVEVLVRAYSNALFYSWDFRTNLSIATAASENDILLCAVNGDVWICSKSIQTCEHIGRTIGPGTAQQVLERGYLRVDADASRLYGNERIAIAVPVYGGGDTALGIVVVSAERAGLRTLNGQILRVLLLTAILVLAVSLLATPYLTRRETKPIKDMAQAARHIAHGDYQVRIPTGHHNEEIEELALAFNHMTQALQNSETNRQEFVANVSHELKTPMTTIAGYLEGMLDGTIPQEKHPYYMELVCTEVRRLSRLVRSMLEISRLKDQGIPTERLRSFDVCETLGQALLSFEQRINQKNLHVDVQMPDYGLSVRAHEDSIIQVLYNLLDNGVKFAQREGELWLSVTQRGNQGIITVGNTGETIPPQELPKLFDRFHKTDKSRSGDRDGVGLGLYIVKTIVNAHGGDIYVTSREGRTEFTFTLPLA